MRMAEAARTEAAAVDAASVDVEAAERDVTRTLRPGEHVVFPWGEEAVVANVHADKTVSVHYGDPSQAERLDATVSKTLRIVRTKSSGMKASPAVPMTMPTMMPLAGGDKPQASGSTAHKPVKGVAANDAKSVLSDAR